MLAVQPAENAHRRNTHEPDLGNASVGTGYIQSALGGLPAKRFFDCIRTQGIPTNIEMDELLSVDLRPGEYPEGEIPEKPDKKTDGKESR